MDSGAWGCLAVWKQMRYGSFKNNATDKLFAYKSYREKGGGARGVMVTIGNGHGDSSSNPGRDWLHFR